MSEKKNQFKVGLGVTGGIAAYKAIEVLRLLQKSDCDVRVAMTTHAAEFIQPLTFRALSGHYVLVDDYDSGNPDPIAHINFSQEIDLFLVVPATANTLAKFANGIADDFITSTYLASTAPVLVAPAMNTTMWNQPATARNIARLKSDGVRFVEPIAGELACKTVGTGKLEDVENIAAQAMAMLKGTGHSARDLENERVVITVGGTREAIDPVRFISNRSSGRMGFALARAAFERGAEVTVIAGSTSVDPPTGPRIINALSAAEMHEAVFEEISDATVFIGAAAVADYRPKSAAASKIKKKDRDEMSLELERTEDILAKVSSTRRNGVIVAGFAAETTNVVEYATEKLKKKNLDLVIANDITKDGAGFNSETNIASIIEKGGAAENLPKMSKLELAHVILDRIAKIRDAGK
ncbi:MAG: bifunctional phosphopantothenoylcysteine decarboxylase/phosphopantothenate--cysteine ligase CoaBC [Pyrinomonadaceae bacterium]|nr:bifunctional phosphopantothenoylcysteine decarboxylase/phosphopantothenate--cysteine ligase CoaBC [Pyrinomonadaceae bacterium]